MPDIFFGQNLQLDVISKSHGRVTPQFAEQADVDISLTNKRLYFLGSKKSFPISVYEGVSGRFGYLETEETLVNTAIMDISPSAAMINDDPSAYVEFQLLLNSKNETGIVKHGTFIQGCRVTSAPETNTPREEQHNTVSYIGAIRYKVKGGGVQYARFVGASPAYATVDDITISGSGGISSGTLALSGTLINIENAVTTRSYLAMYRNGSEVSKVAAYTTGFSISGTQVIFPSGTFTAATDVVELYVPYATV